MRKFRIWLCLVLVAVVPFLVNCARKPHLEMPKVALDFNEDDWNRECIIDDAGLFGDDYELRETLHDVFVRTGVQPIILTTDWMESSEVIELYQEKYSGCMLLLMCTGGDLQQIWADDIAKIIWDEEEAQQLFWNYFNDYYNGTPESLCKVYQLATDGIMLGRNSFSIVVACVVRVLFVSVLMLICSLIIKLFSAKSNKSVKSKKSNDNKSIRNSKDKGAVREEEVEEVEAPEMDARKILVEIDQDGD